MNKETELQIKELRRELISLRERVSWATAAAWWSFSLTLLLYTTLILKG